jgi:hypothetical protein
MFACFSFLICATNLTKNRCCHLSFCICYLTSNNTHGLITHNTRNITDTGADGERYCRLMVVATAAAAARGAADPLFLRAYGDITLAEPPIPVGAAADNGEDEEFPFRHWLLLKLIAFVRSALNRSLIHTVVMLLNVLSRRT